MIIIAKKYIPDILVILSLFLGLFLFLHLSGTLYSGYHLIDDHGILSIKDSLNGNSFFNVLWSYIKADFLIRFRPIFSIYIVMVAKFFGLNFSLISVFVATLGFISATFFYLALRKLNYSKLYSFLFPLLIFAGPQMSILWRLGVNETIAIFFFALTLFFMAISIKKEKKLLWNILFTIFLILTTLCKESFIIVIPAMISFKILIESSSSAISLRESIRRNWLLGLPIIFMFLELVLIKFFVGTNKIGYAGVPSSLSGFITGIREIMVNQNSLYYWFLLLIPILFLWFLSFQKLKKENSKTLIANFSFFVLLIGPQILMHTKSGMIERYLVPTTIGFSFLIVWLIKNTKHNSLKYFSIIIVCAFLIFSYNVAFKNAHAFAEEGKDTRSLLESITEDAPSNSNILLVVDPVTRFEVSYSLKTYFEIRGYKIYAYPVDRLYSSDFEKGLRDDWEKWFIDKKLENIDKGPDAIIIFDKVTTGSFFEQTNLNKEDYEQNLVESSTHAVYRKK